MQSAPPLGSLINREKVQFAPAGKLKLLNPFILVLRGKGQSLVILFNCEYFVFPQNPKFYSFMLSQLNMNVNFVGN